MKYLVTSDSHHNTDRPELKVIVEATPETIEFEALKRVFDYDTSYIDYDEQHTGKHAHTRLKEAYDEVKADPTKEVAFEIPDIYSDVPGAEKYQFVLWCTVEKNGHLNLGFGQTDDGTVAGSDKSENRWVGYKAWERDEKHYQYLLQFTKEQLADKICMLEATR